MIFLRNASLALIVKGNGGEIMLKTYSSTWDYRDFLYSNKVLLDRSHLDRLDSPLYRSARHKLSKVNLTLVFDILTPLYSNTGRPAIDPFILICSFILMQHLGYISIKRWCEDLRYDNSSSVSIPLIHLPLLLITTSSYVLPVVVLI